MFWVEESVEEQWRWDVCVCERVCVCVCMCVWVEEVNMKAGREREKKTGS
jgi:hypothetical protein